MKTRTALLPRPLSWTWLALALAALLAVSCSSAASPVPTSPPAPTNSSAVQPAPATTGAALSFSGDIQPILQQSCVKCHGGARPSAGLGLTSYADLLKGAGGRAVVVPGNAGSSQLAKVVTQGRMPQGGPKLPQAQIDLITAWEDQGALDN